MFSSAEPPLTHFSSLWQLVHASVSNLKMNLFSLVYHHWDGYPEWLGRILTTHYNTKEKVAELIDGGDMSSCWNDTVWGKISC